MTHKFTPTKPEPNEVVKLFIDEKIQEFRKELINSSDNKVYQCFDQRNGSSSAILKTYAKVWEILYQTKKAELTNNLTKILADEKNPDYFSIQVAKHVRILTLIGLINVVKNYSEVKWGPGGKAKYTVSLGPNAWAIENNKALVTFTQTELKSRLANSGETRKKKDSLVEKSKQVKEEKEPESVSLATVPANNLGNLFLVTERIHADFKELERRLELRKPANPKQYYQDLRLIEHLKGEFATLMTQILPENEENLPVTATVENPGELLQLTANLK